MSKENKHKRKINETVIKEMTLGDYIYDTELLGFRAEKKKRGGVIFYLRYRANGKRNTFKIGAHGAITVAQAREQAKIQCINHQGLTPLR